MPEEAKISESTAKVVRLIEDMCLSAVNAGHCGPSRLSLGLALEAMMGEWSGGYETLAEEADAAESAGP